MGRTRNNTPELNAGSMADIAFLLLIFFFVTTTVGSEVGFKRMLPEMNDNTNPTPIPEREVLVVHANASGKLLINDQEKELGELAEELYRFLYNEESLIDQPSIATIQATGAFNAYRALAKEGMVFLKFQQNMPYKQYIAIQDQLMAGYAMLWEQVTQMAANRSYETLDRNTVEGAKLIKMAKTAFPVRIAEETVS